MTLTKEWLQQTIAELEEERDAVPGAVNEDATMALAAMKLALASLEAEPVPVSMKDHQIRELVNELRDIAVEYHGTQQLRERIARTVRASMFQGAEPVTTANKLSFEQWLSQQTGTIDVECGCIMTEVFFHWLRVAYEAGNSPVTPDCWVACSERMPEDNQEVITYNIFGYRHVSFFDEHSGHFFDRLDGSPVDCVEHVLVSHWMPLPAAPQQEE
ncbi:TPA: DUF551 domain-containing protein [Escherichia coli]